MMAKKVTGLLFVMLLAAMVGTGCSDGKTASSDHVQTKAPETTAYRNGKSNQKETEEEENYETGDAALDNTRNQNEIGENELLVVSFGTSYNDNRRLTIGSIEEAMEKAFPKYSVRRGFTSQIIIDHVKKRDNVVIDNVKEALDRAADNGVKELLIQPTHLMNGLEYKDLENEVAGYASSFGKVVIGKPLLTSDEDFKAVMDAVVDATKPYDDGETAICFMGHGTEADSNRVYEKMQDTFTDAGKTNYFVGTVEATPNLEDVLAKVKEGKYKKVVLRPLMIVAGDHAKNDMAGDKEDSWKKTFESAGYEVECVVEGLGQLEAIQNLFVEHVKEAEKELNSKVFSSKSLSSDAIEGTGNTVKSLGLKDGNYQIEVTLEGGSGKSSVDSPAKLSIKEGKAYVTITWGSSNYDYMKVDGEKIEPANREKYSVFEIPVAIFDRKFAVIADTVAMSEPHEIEYTLFLDSTTIKVTNEP